jgi:DeoR family transcriptional regulator, suf operon transcriptional repressor
VEDQSKTTRDRVLQTLLSRQRCTINEIAESVDINPISVRHHITRMEAEERHGVGRPRRVYFLTEEGLEKFPSRYLRLTLRLLEQLKGTMPSHMVSQLFAQMAEDVASDYQAQLSGLDMEQRLNLVTDLLRQEGFIVQWEKSNNEYIIREIGCPYYHVGQNHPEVCSVDQTLISKMLSVPAEKVQCLLRGDAHCMYIIPNMSPVES